MLAFPMTSSSQAVLLSFFVLLPSTLCQQPNPHQCDETFSFFGTDIAKAANLTYCQKLRALGAELGWNFHNATTANTTVTIVFSAAPPVGTGWIAWGVNPGPKPRMSGTRALVAIGQAVGPPVVASYNVTTDTLMGCKLENSSVEFRAEGVRSNYSSVTGRMVLAATLRLPSEYNPSRLNHVWQVGPASKGMALVPHAQQLHNFDGVDTLDLATGYMFGHSNTALRDAHGVLSVIGWGIIMPAGILIVRYFRTFPFQREEYFLLHASCQLSAYVVGTTGWGIGLSLLGGTRYYKTIMGHRVIGILIFCLATLQMMALWLKPKRRDKYRRYWSIYHHFVGYSLVALTVVNIFKGFKILRPPPKWRWVYVAILASIGCAVLVLEIVTWYKFYGMQRKKAREHKDEKSAKLVQVTSDIQVG